MANLMACFVLIYVYHSTAVPPPCDYHQNSTFIPRGFLRSDAYVFVPDFHNYDFGKSGVVHDKSGAFFLPPFCLHSFQRISRPVNELLNLEDPRLPVLSNFEHCAPRRLSIKDAEYINSVIASTKFDDLPEFYSHDIAVYELRDEDFDICFTLVSFPSLSIRFYRCHVDRTYRRINVISTSFASTALDVFTGVLSSLEHFVQLVVRTIIRAVFTVFTEAIVHLFSVLLPYFCDVVHFFESWVDVVVPFGVLEASLFAAVCARLAHPYVIFMFSVGVALVSVKLNTSGI
nr:hypothetical protein [Ailanthus crinkle leaf associated bluner-like virus]